MAVGVKSRKAQVLSELDPELADLHASGYMHIHDLDGYGRIHNCSSPEVANCIHPEAFRSVTVSGKMAELFEGYRALITSLATMQSGGIGFSKFDIDTAALLDDLGIESTVETDLILRDCVGSFLQWLNTSRTRFSRELYYVTLHVGLSTGVWGRKVTQAVIDAFQAQPLHFKQPNIVFKVKESLHGDTGSAPNRDLYLKALSCTAHRMIPTYLLLDSAPNADCDPELLGIMGCRSRIEANCNGRAGGYGRGNAAYVTLNLPRIALESEDVASFYDRLGSLLPKAKAVLDGRAAALVKGHAACDDPVFDIWMDGVDSIEDLVANATHSIGFIGVAETVQILTGETYHLSKTAQALGMSIVRYLRAYVDEQRQKCSVNYSLLATSGEFISGKFVGTDAHHHPHPLQEKGFYTNSFHVAVDAGVPVCDKLRIEGPFHLLCNGGSISYVE
ncbi:hypothetical protein KIPB_012070, partial [Kipferlia bialata]|eukprot:g12070.t1